MTDTLPLRGRALRRHLAFELLEPRQVLSTTTVVLNPVADTFTHSGVNAGSQATLTTRDRNGAGGDYMAYLRFDLSAVDLTGLTNAYFTLQRTAGSATIVVDRFDVYGLSNLAGNTAQNWNETTLADAGLGAEYNNTAGNYVDVTRVVKLDEDGTAPANVIEQVSNGGPAQNLSGADVEQFVKDRKADGGLATFIVLVDAGADRTLNYGSRENANPALRPKLTLEYSPAYSPTANPTPRQMEHLNRGVVVMRRATAEAYVGWRMLGTDPANVSFNVYRSAGGGAAAKLNATPIRTSTNYVDTTFNATVSNAYYVRPIINGVEQASSESFTLVANAPTRQYLNIPLQIPASYTITFPPGSLTPPAATDIDPGTSAAYGGAAGQDSFTADYTANDASVADLDGDGAYEIIVKWEPTNASNAGFSEFTGKNYFDAYNLAGTRLWRIDTGINIRASAQYQPFLGYDLDGDGKAEVVMRTAPGTIDGQGNPVILPGDNPNADYRDPYTGAGDGFGRITTGPEYLTVFNGVTGAAMATVPFTPNRDNISTWGDDYGHRGENLLIVPAYLDGQRPSIVIGRGIFPADSTFPVRNELTAWNWRDGQLTQQWWFRGNNGYLDSANSQYTGQGVYTMVPADVDGDGRDEIVFGSMVIDDDGTGLYSTSRGHGDALHVADMDLSNPGLEVFMPSEFSDVGDHRTAILRDAATGRIIAAPFVAPADVAAGTFPDVGRGVAFDIDPNFPGYEFWDSYDANIFDSHGNVIYAKPSNMHQNFGVWWDADLLRETLDNTTIGDWNYTTHGRTNLVSFSNTGINNSSGLTANNGTKSTPALSGDILGDWREEVVWRTSDNTALQIWSSAITSSNKLTTLAHDAQYREALAWQNVGYNQPPNPSYFLGAGMTVPPQPLIYTLPVGGSYPGDFNGDGMVDADDLPIWRAFAGQSSITGLQPGDADGDRDADAADFLIWQRNLGETAPSVAAIAVAGDSSLSAAVTSDAIDAAITVATNVTAPTGFRRLTAPLRFRDAVPHEAAQRATAPSRRQRDVSAPSVFVDAGNKTSSDSEGETDAEAIDAALEQNAFAACRLKSALRWQR